MYKYVNAFKYVLIKPRLSQARQVIDGQKRRNSDQGRETAVAFLDFWIYLRLLQVRQGTYLDFHSTQRHSVITAVARKCWNSGNSHNVHNSCNAHRKQINATIIILWSIAHIPRLPCFRSPENTNPPFRMIRPYYTMCNHITHYTGPQVVFGSLESLAVSSAPFLAHVLRSSACF